MVNWAQILLDTGIDVPEEFDEFSIRCPFHEDGVASCSINIDKGVWICFAGCGQGTLKSFLKKYLDCNGVELEKMLFDNQMDFNIDIFDDLQATIEQREEYFMEADTSTFPSWIFERGFSEQILREWGCGTTEYQDLVIPIHNLESTLVGSVTRRINAIPKYMYSKGLRKSEVIFGAYKLTEPKKYICITEGSLDTMWLTQNGHPSVAILGATTSRKQLDILKSLRTEEFILCFDNDEAGQRAISRAMLDISTSFMVSYIKIPKKYKDVQDVRSKALLNEVIANRHYW
jgi:DNA primase